MNGFRLSPQQRRLFQLAEAASDTAAHRAPDAAPFVTGGLFRLRGELDVEHLERCWRELIERYEILTTSFHRPAGLELPLQLPGGRDDAAFHVDPAGALDESLVREGASILEAGAAAQSSEPPLSLQVVGRGETEHLLLWTQPSLYGDAISVANLLDELLRLYAAGEAATDDAGDADADGPLQYADLAEWLNEILEEEGAGDGIAYWERQRRAASAPTFPLRRTGSSKAWRAGLSAVTLAPPTRDALRRRATELGLPLESLLHGLWAALLTRYTDSRPLRLDTLFDGRSYEGLEEAVGLFARYLPIVVDVRPADRLEDLVLRLGAVCSEAAEWQEYYAPEPAVHPTGTYGFSFCETPAARYGDLEREVVALHATLEPHLLELACRDSGEELGLDLIYDAFALTAQDAEGIAAAFGALCDDALRRPERSIDELALVAEPRRAAPFSLPTDRSEPPAWSRVTELIERQVTEHAEGTAAVCGNDSASYAELWDRSGAIAARLEEAGVAADEPVGVCCERSVDLVAALLGVLRSGAAYLPLDPANPDDRLAFMLRDAGARLLVHHAATAARAAESSGLATSEGTAEVVSIDLDRVAPGEPRGAPEPTGDDLAYIIYTSGSTGEPKGVAVTHANLTHSTAARLHVYPQPPGRFLLLSSYAFDSSVAGLFWTLGTGGTLVLPEEGTEQDIGLMADEIERLGITHTLCLPTLYTLLLEQGSPDETSLEVVAVAGETCPAALARRHFEIRPSVKLVNEYGPTEATVWATAAVLEPGMLEPTVPIGRPVPHATAHLLDPAGQTVPAGVPGEIHLGGAGIARGYLGRPELTAERFLDDEFSDRPGARLYRTGDRGRWRSDGQLEFLDRLDHQIKLRGYRIEPGEIESRLEACDGVRQAVVVPRAGDGGEPRLVAYLVATSAAAPGVSELRAELQRHLPEYMIPAAFVTLQEMPLTPTGKVDRRALPEPEQQRPDLAAAYEPPRGEIETYLVGRWEEILQTERVGVLDDFFELGGNSIQAAIFMNRIRGEIDDFIHVGRLFENPTVRQLTAYLEREHAAALENLGRRPSATAPGRQPDGEDPAERVDRMSDEEVDSMLEELLSEQERGA